MSDFGRYGNQYNFNSYPTREPIQPIYDYPNVPHDTAPLAPIEKYSHIGDFTPFYIVVTICSIIGFSLFILNIFLGCCSKYSDYWQDRHTGNRWIISLWTSTPHNQSALDYPVELQEISSVNQVVYDHPQEIEHSERSEFLELRPQRESEI